MADLITVPTFIFEQGDLLKGGVYPIQVLYWRDGIIELRQGENEVMIKIENIDPLCREIKKHFDDANKSLNA